MFSQSQQWTLGRHVIGSTDEQNNVNPVFIVFVVVCGGGNGGGGVGGIFPPSPPSLCTALIHRIARCVCVCVLTAGRMC